MLYDFNVPADQADDEEAQETVEELERELLAELEAAHGRGAPRDRVLEVLTHVSAPDEPGYEMDLLIARMRLSNLGRGGRDNAAVTERDVRTGRFVQSAAADALDEQMNAALFAGVGRARASAPASASTSPSPPATAGVFSDVMADRHPKGDWLQQAFQRQRGRLSNVPLPEHRNPETP